jgi:hypothetical protein
MIGQSDAAEPSDLALEWCFRHQLLLYRQSYPRLIDTDQDARLSELDFLRQPKKHRQREDLP